MILIQRYIFKELIFNFAFTFVVITLIMILVLSVKVIFQFPLGFLVLVKIVPLMLVASLSIIIPLTVLVSVVLTYGRVAADNELVTMRASGVHVLRILVPGILFGLLCSLFLLFVNDRLFPRAERFVKTMATSDNLQSILDSQLLRGIKELRLDDWLLTWDRGRKVEASGEEEGGENPLGRWRFYGLRAMQYDEADRVVREIRAESAFIVLGEGERRSMVLLRNIKIVYGKQKGATAGEFPIPFDLGRRHFLKFRVTMRDFAALAAILGRKHKAYPDYVVRTEIHKRIAGAFGPLVFVFLALPIAILFKEQNRMVAFLIAILLALFIYFPVFILGESLADKGVVDPVLSIWPGTVLLSLIGFVLILKVMKR